MGTNTRPALLTFVRDDEIESFRADIERHRREGFPVYSLNRDEKWHALLGLLVADHATLIDAKGHIRQSMFGLALAWNYFPYAWTIKCGSRKTPIELFRNDQLLMQAMEKRVRFRHAATPSGLRKILRTFSSTQSVSNFRPTAAAAVYHRLLPEDGGVVWDMCGGFGGRLLGALACDRVDKYIGTDPDSHAIQGLREMAEELVPVAAQLGRRTLEVELHQTGSEVFAPERESLELCFTSPSYFGWEQYSNESSQSHRRFPSKESWLHKYIGATLRNCSYGLRRNGMLALNIANVASYPSLARDVVVYAESNGWRLVETLHLQLSKMIGLKHLTKGAFKSEPVFVFKKR